MSPSLFRLMNSSKSGAARYAPLFPTAVSSYREEVESKNSSEDFESDKATLTGVSDYTPRRNRLHVFLYVLIGLTCGIVIGMGSAWFVNKRAMSPKPVREFAPEMPMATVVFEEIPELSGPPSRTTNAYWDSLVPPGNGFLQVPNPEDYDLKPGIPTRTSVERYSLAMYHQFHCVALIRRYYWDLVDALSNGLHEDPEVLRHHLGRRHQHHCFAYLAQSVLCNADLTVEWPRVETDGRRLLVDGWGIPHKQCKDPKAVREWADKHHSPERVNETHIDGSLG